MDANEAPIPADVASASGFAAFYDAHASVVFGYLLRLCGGDSRQAEEIAQQAWFELVDQLASGHVERARVAWLLTVARSRYLDGWRRERRFARSLRVAWTNPDPVDPWEPDRTDVLEHLAGLEADQRVVLVLRYIDGLAVPEIAEQIGRTTAATYSLLARGRRELRARLEGGRDV